MFNHFVLSSILSSFILSIYISPLRTVNRSQYQPQNKRTVYTLKVALR